MAVYNEILVGRFNNLIKKWMGFKGQAPAPQLASEINAAFNLPIGVETRFLEGWYRYGFTADQPAVAGLTTAQRFRNPAGSNIIAVIEKMSIWSAAAQNIQFRMRANAANEADLGGPNQPFTIEQRGKLNPNDNPMKSNIHMSQDLAGNQAGTIMWMYPVVIGQMVEIIFQENQELVIDPGNWLNVFGDLANTRWVINFLWRERPLEESERS